MMMNSKPMSQQAQRLIAIKDNATRQAQMLASMQVDKIAGKFHTYAMELLADCDNRTDTATRVAVENTVRMMLHKLGDLCEEYPIRAGEPSRSIIFVKGVR